MTLNTNNSEMSSVKSLPVFCQMLQSQRQPERSEPYIY